MTKEQVLNQIKHFGKYKGEDAIDIDSILNMHEWDAQWLTYLLAKGVLEEAKSAKFIRLTESK